MRIIQLHDRNILDRVFPASVTDAVVTTSMQPSSIPVGKQKLEFASHDCGDRRGCRHPLSLKEWLQSKSMKESV